MRRNNSVLGVAALGFVDQMYWVAVLLLGPDIRRALGMSRVMYGASTVLSIVLLVAAGFVAAAMVRKRATRTDVLIAVSISWVMASAALSFAPSTSVVLVLVVAAGAVRSVLPAVARPLLVDVMPIDLRGHALAVVRGAEFVGVAGGAALVVALGSVSFTWRAAFICVSLAAVAGVVLVRRVADSEPGARDLDMIRGDEQSPEASDLGDGDPALEEALRLTEVLRRLFLVPTATRIFMVLAVVGMTMLPLWAALLTLFEDRWRLDYDQRALVLLVLGLAAAAGAFSTSRKLDETFERDPKEPLLSAALFLAIGAGALVVGAAARPMFLSIGLFALAMAAIARVLPSVDLALFAVVPARHRGEAGALAAVFFVGVGSLGGLQLTGEIGQRFGPGWAIAVLAVPLLSGVSALRKAGDTVGSDVGRSIADLTEDEELRQDRRAGRTQSLIACRDTCFSYGELQVLFDVSFSVDDNEMVALLGTNGAGKSTLLRVISGLAHPQSGSVRFQGADVTFLDPERRQALGITQIDGGKAVFGALTVAENLRVFGSSVRRSKGAVESSIDIGFATFPVLAARRNQLASTLSGGEQQMLGLCKAFIMRPRLLLIDELSLGLAPKVIAELLDMVRTIHANGAAVVLVEQSVTTALDLVDHAYFMEKGQVRFDGAAKDLLGRGDLLRSVFLKGAAGALAP